MYLPSDMKGYLGEREVKEVLKLLERQGVRHLYNAVVPRGSTVTQIDFMLFSKRVFLCLEVKAWSGEIFIPSEENGKWKLVYGRQTIRPHNPLDQNDAHTRAANANSLCGVKYENYVVFPKNPIIHNKLYNTGSLADLVNFIFSANEKYPQEFVDKEYAHFEELTQEYYPDFMEKEYLRQMRTEFEKTSLFGDDYD